MNSCWTSEGGASAPRANARRGAPIVRRCLRLRSAPAQHRPTPGTSPPPPLAGCALLLLAPAAYRQPLERRTGGPFSPLMARRCSTVCNMRRGSRHPACSRVSSLRARFVSVLCVAIVLVLVAAGCAKPHAPVPDRDLPRRVAPQPAQPQLRLREKDAALAGNRARRSVACWAVGCTAARSKQPACRSARRHVV